MNILVPLDGSDSSESVLPYVRSLGEREGVHVALLRVTDPFLSTPYGLAHELNEATRGQVVATSTGYLANIESRLSLDRISCWSVVGSAQEEICREAKVQNCELIVMASQGHNVAEEVIRMAPCPVLFVRPPAPERSGFESILVPIDGSPESLEVHLQLAPYRGRHTKITLLTASGLTAQDPDYLLARERLQAYMEKLEGEFEVQVADGEAGPSILSWAEQEGCDLIAMSSRGHGSVRSFFLGSVTQQVLRQAGCSVLIFPAGFVKASTDILSRQTGAD